MKCDKLKPLKNIECAFNTATQQEQVISEDSEGNCYGFDSLDEVYLKSEADKVISDLKARIAQLEDDNSLLRKNNAELRSKNEGLLYALADAETNIDISTRWRKYSEEKPEDEECVLVVIEGKVEKVRYRKFDGSFHNTHFSLLNHSVKWWMPMPSAPKEEE